MKLKAVLFVVFYFGVFGSGELIAGSVENNAKKLEGIKSEIKKMTQAVNELNADKKALLLELKTLEVGYGKSSVLLKTLREQIAGLNKRLKDNKQQRKVKQLQIQAQKQGLENQVKAAYRTGENEKLKMMLNQQDPASSGRVMTYYDFFNKSRLKQIHAIDQDLQIIKELEDLYQQESELLDKKLVVKTQQQTELSLARVERKAILKKLNQQVNSTSQQLKRLKRSEKELAALIVKLQAVKDDFPAQVKTNKAFSRLKGALPWPLRGRLLKKFGDRRSDSRWDGVLIGAKEGQEVRAISRGRVVYADWLRGYGLLTIIKHDKGYMTLYAFNQSLYKLKGDWVEAGTVISTVGLSGGRSSAGLYFGVRKKGKPVNPSKWCRKIRGGKTR